MFLSIWNVSRVMGGDWILSTANTAVNYVEMFGPGKGGGGGGGGECVSDHPRAITGQRNYGQFNTHKLTLSSDFRGLKTDTQTRYYTLRAITGQRNCTRKHRHKHTLLVAISEVCKQKHRHANIPRERLLDRGTTPDITDTHLFLIAISEACNQDQHRHTDTLTYPESDNWPENLLQTQHRHTHTLLIAISEPCN